MHNYGRNEKGTGHVLDLRWGTRLNHLTKLNPNITLLIWYLLYFPQHTHNATTPYTLCAICPGQLKKPDVEVLGCCGFTWSGVVKPVERTAKFSKRTFNSLATAFWTFLQTPCKLHTPSNLETSVALCCVTKLHILEWPFIAPAQGAPVWWAFDFEF
jgi:hypothetical protein